MFVDLFLFLYFELDFLFCFSFLKCAFITFNFFSGRNCNIIYLLCVPSSSIPLSFVYSLHQPPQSHCHLPPIVLHLLNGCSLHVVRVTHFHPTVCAFVTPGSVSPTPLPSHLSSHSCLDLRTRTSASLSPGPQPSSLNCYAFFAHS